jgi:RNA polymerase sigma-70 factor, ECF subfamily
MNQIQVPTDSDLLSRCRSGELTAFQALVDRYAALVYALALALTKDPHEAEYVTERTFAQLMDQCGADPMPRDISVWLCAVAAANARASIFRALTTQ